MILHIVNLCQAPRLPTLLGEIFKSETQGEWQSEQ